MSISSSTCDPVAMAHLYQACAPTVLRYIRGHLASREDAKDILLEVFVAVLEQPHVMTLPLEKQQAWLLRVAYYKVVDLYRFSARRQQIPLEICDEIHDEVYVQQPEDWVIGQEEHYELRAHIQELPIAQQELLHMRFVAELSYAEIAHHFQKRESTIRVWLSRTLQTLRRSLLRRERGLS